MNQQIHLSKEDMKFSIAHFTIFSATERENLHGHNYNMEVNLNIQNLANGMAFNYRDIKSSIRNICRRLDEKFIVQMNSPYLKIKEKGEYVSIIFNSKEMILPSSDVLLLPIVNTTLECFGDYLLAELLKDLSGIHSNNITKVELKISSGPGQSYSKTNL